MMHMAHSARSERHGWAINRAVCKCSSVQHGFRVYQSGRDRSFLCSTRVNVEFLIYNYLICIVHWNTIMRRDSAFILQGDKPKLAFSI